MATRSGIAKLRPWGKPSDPTDPTPNRACPCEKDFSTKTFPIQAARGVSNCVRLKAEDVFKNTHTVTLL
jgi:hypothetical protein